jgi:hypothetical protein
MHSLLNLFVRMFVAYISPGEGLVFCLMHVVLFWLFFVKRREIQSEARDLADWEPDKDSHSRCGEVLDDFALDSKRMGALGIPIALTDFTDRLDSIVEGDVGRLQDTVNLFLVIGIAGTIFGLFGFVTGGGDIQDQMSKALGRALPVTFFGMAWYVLGYILSSRPEQVLRNNVASATQKALKNRAEHTVSVPNAIAEALKPIQGLQSTLSEVLQPIVKEWGKRLEDTYKLVAHQMAAMEGAVQSINQAAISIENGVRDLARSSESLSRMLSESPEVFKNMKTAVAEQLKEMKRLSVLVDGQEKSLAALNAETARVQEIMETAGNSLLGLSEIFKTQTAIGIKRVSEEIVVVHATAAAEASEKFTNAAEEWRELAANSRSNFQIALDQAVQGTLKVAHQELPQLADFFINHLPGIVQQTQVAADKWREVAHQMEELRSKLPAFANTPLPPPIPPGLVEDVRQILEQSRRCAELILSANELLENPSRHRQSGGPRPPQSSSIGRRIIDWLRG